MNRDPITNPQNGDIVRSTIYKNGRERHVLSKDGLLVRYIAVSPSNSRTMQCWLRPWVEWCEKNKVEIIQRGDEPVRVEHRSKAS